MWFGVDFVVEVAHICEMVHQFMSLSMTYMAAAMRHQEVPQGAMAVVAATATKKEHEQYQN
jgi:hypothetical protein